MNTSDVIYILAQHGYSVNTWTDLADVTMITMLQDTNIPIHPTEMRVRFNTTEGLLEIVYGTTASNIFTSNAGNTSNFTATTFVPFSELCGFLSSIYRAANGGYYTKFFAYPPKM